ncbi:MAG TPA: gamma-glutamyltransferase [Thermoplasmata archaeon]|nr:gamma-glutamyltransferase [Thermoplasmata archaeon]
MRGSTRWAVASAHPLSTAAGLEVLRAGGNAYDAALAVSAALPVVQPHMNGLGSDFFAVLRDGSNVAVNSNGPAGREVDPEVYRRRRWSRIPARGPLSTITVPGLVAAWGLLGDRGRLPFRRCLAPAIRFAARGFPASPNLARAARSVRWGDRDFHRLYGAVRTGQLLRQSSLAKTLARVASDRGHGFYHGSLARRICRDLTLKGGLLQPADFDGFDYRVVPPLSVRYRAYRVWTNPPPSQGATALIWMNLLARRDLSSLPTPEFLGTLARAMRVAYDYRAKVIGDPSVLRFPRSLLRPGARYRRAVATVRPRRPGSSDTTAFSVFDGEVGISAIQSNYGGFGSGVAVQGTGITLNNRGSYFTLDPNHPNVLAPGKRTFHTLMATLVTGPRTVLFGSMGGDVQPQVNVQVLTRHLDRRESLSEAIHAPRFAYPATIYGTAGLYREPGLPLAGARLLRNRPDAFGHAQGISIGEEIEVGVDPRGDGLLPLPS